jgi:hypothetical protein
MIPVFRFFHAPTKQGGLDIPVLRCWVPIIRRQRCWRAIASLELESVFDTLKDESEYVKETIMKLSKPVHYEGKIVSDKQSLQVSLVANFS